MKSFSEARRIALQISTAHGLDYEKVYEDIKEMDVEEVRKYIADIREKGKLTDA